MLRGTSGSVVGRRGGGQRFVYRPPVPVIGGVPVGTQGNSGIYSGYTMVGGDDFDGGLDVMNINAPNARYGVTHVYYPGARSVSGALQKSYDLDPYHTGSQDSKKGVPVGSTDLMVQANSILALKARIANGGETSYINGRPIVSAMIHSGGYLVVSAPCIIEALVSFTGSNPQGWHPTFWVQSASPLDTNASSASPGGLEYDFPECSSTQAEANFNPHGSTIGPAFSSTVIASPFGAGFKLYSLEITSSAVNYYLNGVLVKTVAQDGTNTNRPYFVLFTNHTYDQSFGGDANVDVAAWTAKGASGAIMSIDYFRAWLPNAAATNVLKPLTSLPVQQVAYNSPITYNFPSASALWGAGVTDYPQALRHEDFEPGATGEGTTGYYPFPADLSWNLGTRVLSGSVTSRPGRLHTMVTPHKSGGALGYVARGYIDVGPTVRTTILNGTVNVPFNYDMYQDLDCGTLVPKTMSVVNLPSPLSFDASTGVISGTPTSSGTTSITATVTNSVGQTASKTFNIVIAASVGPTLDGTPVTVATSATTASVSHTTTVANTILVAAVKSGDTNAGAVTSVTDSSGLTWTKRFSQVYGGASQDMEIWWALAPTAGTRTVTVTVGTTAAPTIRLGVFAVKDSSNTAAPFDTNAALPASSKTGFNVTSGSATVSTTASSAFVFAWLCSAGQNFGTVTRPSGFTSIVNVGTFHDLSGFIANSSLSSVTETFSWTGSGGYGLVIDAIR